MNIHEKIAEAKEHATKMRTGQTVGALIEVVDHLIGQLEDLQKTVKDQIANAKAVKATTAKPAASATKRTAKNTSA